MTSAGEHGCSGTSENTFFWSLWMPSEQPYHWLRRDLLLPRRIFFLLFPLLRTAPFTLTSLSLLLIGAIFLWQRLIYLSCIMRISSRQFDSGQLQASANESMRSVLRGRERWEVRGERWEVRGERWEVRGERWEVRGERREARGERREVRGERREARGERR